jgi:glycine/D-amino acid oxidase-like deaminating enzyme
MATKRLRLSSAAGSLGTVAADAERMDGSPRVVVVGGGITGVCSAYFLARAGAAVHLVERGAVGGQASGHNAGGINPLHGPGIPTPLLGLALASMRLHTEMWEATGGDSSVTLNGRRVERVHLVLEDEDVGPAELAAALHDATPGFGSRWLAPDELRDLVPGVTTSARRALCTSGNLWVDPEHYTAAVAASARRQGVRLVEAEACGIRCSGERAVAVELGGGVLPCDAVVCATGPWTGQLDAWFGVRLAVRPLKGQLLLVRATGGLPGVELTWRRFGLYTAPGPRAWLGGTEEESGFDTAPSEAARRSILSDFEALLPGVSVRVVRQVAGLRPLSGDGLPMVGLLKNCENVCLVGAAGRKGMLYGPALGRAAADLLLHGTTTLPIDACGVDRPGLAVA